MRLGFVSGRAAFVRDGQLVVDAGLGRLIDALGARATRLTVALSRSPRPAGLGDHALALAPADFVVLPDMPSTVRGFGQVAACRRALHEVEAKSDVVVVQLPFTAPLALLGAARPRVYHLCADVEAIVASSGAYHGVRALAARGLATGIHHLTRHLVARRGTVTVANGEALLERTAPRRGVAVVSSTIRDAEIGSVPRRRPASAPLRLLFVGYLRPEKGVDVLFDAFERLRAQLPDVELDIVGAPPPGPSAAASGLERRAAELAARGGVRFWGPRPFGPELFACFADADVLVLPSRSEGTPRVLVEARAFGCTVVASNVGGVPSSVADDEDGVLVPPGDAAALTAALLRLARDPARRARLAAAGVARARRTTVDAFAQIIYDEAKRLLSGPLTGDP